jgi:hypothetical protein
MSSLKCYTENGRENNFSICPYNKLGSRKEIQVMGCGMDKLEELGFKPRLRGQEPAKQC